LITYAVMQLPHVWQVFWPSLLALCVVFSSRSALWGLLTGAIAGALVLAEGSPFGAVKGLTLTQFTPIFQSSWKLSAIAFTLILGGFVALIERSGGLQTLVNQMIGAGRASAKRMQGAVVALGGLVFFDGLANTLLIGRLMRSAADRCGVFRVKLAYLADATGSAIACLAFVSTWIAFQLSMIREGYAIYGDTLVSAYALFFRSLPTNFYCWFTLVMVVVSIWRDFNPAPMHAAEKKARASRLSNNVHAVESTGAHWGWAIVPILILALSVPVLTYLLGAKTVWPLSWDGFATAYAAAESKVPLILVLSASGAAILAALSCHLSRGNEASAKSIALTFGAGCRELLGPIGILIAAWMLGAAISQLGAASILSDLLNQRMPLAYIPVSVFLVGAVISFSTGTSWGTMGVLMPLAIPVILGLTADLSLAEQEHFVVSVIGAVFSGAVFGDHCSPFSDTTIVASIASGVEPMDHVKTQLPFALITALISAVCGFLPYGFGVPAPICLIAGILAIVALGFQPIGRLSFPNRD